MKKILATPAAKRVAKEMHIHLDDIAKGPDNIIRLQNVYDAQKACNQKQRITPLARKMAQVHDIDTSLFPNRKITKSDIVHILSTSHDTHTTTDSETLIPLGGMRKIIAENMMHSLQHHAQTTVFSELDTTELVSLHKSLKATFQAQYGVKLTFNHLFIKLVTLALQEHPMINSALIDTNIHVYNHIHMGVATAVDKGLIVPVIRDCQRLSLQEIAQASHGLVQKARKGTLTPSEYSDGTFTISNLGNVSVDYFTPILNSPQSGIMGIARTVKKPVVQNVTITIRSMTHFCLTFDHRVIDGMVAAQFMNTIDRLLSNPAILLL